MKSPVLMHTQPENKNQHHVKAGLVKLVFISTKVNDNAPKPGNILNLESPEFPLSKNFTHHDHYPFFPYLQVSWVPAGYRRPALIDRL
jgi:hypothetical protein